MDSINNILDRERQRYVDFFVETINILKKGKDTFASELLVWTNEQSTPAPFDLIRLDFIYKNESNENKIIEIRLDKNLEYDKTKLERNNSVLTIKLFCWNSCEMTIDKLDKKQLEEWIRKWIEADEEINGQISEVIHSCTLPELIDNKHKFTIDLGTAPYIALLELIDSLTKTGTREINIETIVV